MYSQHMPLAWHPHESERSKSERAHRSWLESEVLKSLAPRRRRPRRTATRPGQQPAIVR